MNPQKKAALEEAGFGVGIPSYLFSKKQELQRLLEEALELQDLARDNLLACAEIFQPELPNSGLQELQDAARIYGRATATVARIRLEINKL